MGTSEIAEKTPVPLPTVHRLLRTLWVNGYGYQTPRRRYGLGTPRVPLSRSAGTSLGANVRTQLAAVVDELHESDLQSAIGTLRVAKIRSQTMNVSRRRRHRAGA